MEINTIPADNSTVMTAPDAGRERPPGWRARLRAVADLLLGTPDMDPRGRAGRLSAVLFLVPVVDVLISAEYLPADVDVRVVWMLTALSALTAGLIAVIPWDRLPAQAPLATSVWGIALLTGAGYYGNALHHYQAFFALVFLFVGMTQRPGSSVALAPAALVGVGVAIAGRESLAVAPDLIGAVAVAVMIGEVLAQLVERHATAARRVEELLTAVTLLNSAHDEATAADRLAALTQQLLEADAVVVTLTEHPGSTRMLSMGIRNATVTFGQYILDVADGHSGVAIAHRTGAPLFVADAPASPALAQEHIRGQGMASVVYVPIPGEGSHLGVIAAWWRTPRSSLDPVAQRITQVLSQQAGQVLERVRSVGRLQTEVRTDVLTGLTNRRGLLEELTQLPIEGAVVMIDLDHFKDLNDRLGHQAGDQVLRTFAEAMRHSVRHNDCAARYGGEEFAIVVSGGGITAAEAVLERLAERWRAFGAPRTYSAGIAVHRVGDVPGTTLNRADAALYAAKRAGRDRTVIAGDDATVTDLHAYAESTAIGEASALPWTAATGGGATETG